MVKDMKDCPECGGKMVRVNYRRTLEYTCPDCGHEEELK